jgi:hypothetical protein
MCSNPQVGGEVDFFHGFSDPSEKSPKHCAADFPPLVDRSFSDGWARSIATVTYEQ